MNEDQISKLLEAMTVRLEKRFDSIEAHLSLIHHEVKGHRSRIADLENEDFELHEVNGSAE